MSLFSLKDALFFRLLKIKMKKYYPIDRQPLQMHEKMPLRNTVCMSLLPTPMKKNPLHKIYIKHLLEPHYIFPKFSQFYLLFVLHQVYIVFCQILDKTKPQKKEQCSEELQLQFSINLGHPSNLGLPEYKPLRILLMRLSENLSVCLIEKISFSIHPIFEMKVLLKSLWASLSSIGNESYPKLDTPDGDAQPNTIHWGKYIEKCNGHPKPRNSCETNAEREKNIHHLEAIYKLRKKNILPWGKYIQEKKGEKRETILLVNKETPYLTATGDFCPPFKNLLSGFSQGYFSISYLFPSFSLSQNTLSFPLSKHSLFSPLNLVFFLLLNFFF